MDEYLSLIEKYKKFLVLFYMLINCRMVKIQGLLCNLNYGPVQKL
ncbi:hypothetical protein DFR55_101239 [Herbinix hemicellulosilytica]|uniref:Uncharacterized protein n=1 Tax=Herbinix hemicellulosilytica TaxID=1564487 RepID=A0A0H5SI29_HERHM|nr:hypothetical protein DFR55_101239 [Herbinix hemicellulosilytica]CRZ34466.1 hypothetical protein HHT355_1264 [Herbinix hemicellulosilytica]